MFNWWTFFFQTLNFFVVLYILYRLFFKPLKNVILKREETIGERLKKLEEDEERIKADEADYLRQMKEIESLREKALDEAKKEALTEKDALMKEASREMAKAFEKQAGIIDQERGKYEKDIRQMSLEFSLYYTERLLKELSDAQLHRKSIDRFLQALPEQAAGEIEPLKETLSGKSCDLVLYTPFEPEEQTLQKIRDTITQLLECKSVVIRSVEDASLIWGVRLGIGNKILDGSIKGVLERFKTELENGL
jgi:F-type H+-transporting ATPase subunit b